MLKDILFDNPNLSDFIFVKRFFTDCKLVTDMNTIYINKEEILKRYKPIQTEAHKGSQGHALLIGGSYGKIGSIVLASKSCLKSGCGLVTAFVPKCGYEILQTSFPEAMVLTDINTENISEITFDIKPNAIGIGMGLGQEKNTQKAFHRFLKNNEKPLLIDADGLNILSENKEWLDLLPKKTILTPHLKELERLIGSWKTEDEKIDKTMEFSQKNNLVIVVKGAPTKIIESKNVYINSTGNQALATAGSGDALSGIITSFLAQGYDPIDASIVGVYIHGLTADIASKYIGFQAFIASDIIENLGKAFLSLDTN